MQGRDTVVADEEVGGLSDSAIGGMLLEAKADDVTPDLVLRPLIGRPNSCIWPACTLRGHLRCH